MKVFLSEALSTILLAAITVGVFLAERSFLKGVVGEPGLLACFLTPVTIFLCVLVILRLAAKKNGTLWMKKSSRIGTAVGWFGEFESKKILALSRDITSTFLLCTVLLAGVICVPYFFYLMMGSKVVLGCLAAAGAIFALAFFVKMMVRLFDSAWFRTKVQPAFARINPDIQLKE